MIRGDGWRIGCAVILGHLPGTLGELPLADLESQVHRAGAIMDLIELERQVRRNADREAGMTVEAADAWLTA